MSADNYYRLRLHPKGGFAAVMGFASDESPDTVVNPAHRSFPTLDAAEKWALGEYSEYGVSHGKDVEDYLAGTVRIDRALLVRIVKAVEACGDAVDPSDLSAVYALIAAPSSTDT